MKRLKNFWAVFLSFLPFTAGAAAPFVIGALAGGVVLAGFSIYRTSFPVNMDDAFRFFSSCWTCQMFSDVIGTLSNILPKIYTAIGLVIIPFTAALLAIWFAWQLLENYMNAKNIEPWSLTGDFGVRLLKLGVVCAMLAVPLPRIINDVAIEPIFGIGMSLNHAVTEDKDFNTCVVATAIADPVSVSDTAATKGAFSPKLRHNLACELGVVHQMTGIGMTSGWTLMNMAFNEKYMHKIMWNIPIFPNVVVFFAGLLIIVLFFAALLPVPLFFLEIFIKLSLDLVMLPLSLMAWVFPGWSILPDGRKNIKSIINDVVQATFGIALTGIFVTFAVMFLNAVFGSWGGMSALSAAFAENDSQILMDGLMMRNDSIVTIIFMGAFIAMFMTSIPALIKTLFNMKELDDFYKSTYQTTKNNLNTVWSNVQKWYKVIKK
ncbi:MAG: hypothetical protein J5679_01120 [Alphaproteobacteria bacterium]|nr:hypothetical protein [Alphaproteobacteria bacterium]